LDPLGPILGSLNAIRRAVDVGAGVAQAVHGGVGPLSGLLSIYLVRTINPLTGGPFTLTPPVAQLTPLVQISADTALGLAVSLIFVRMIVSPVLAGRMRPIRVLPRLLVGALLVNYAPLLLQSAIDASNLLSQAAWTAALQHSWPAILPQLKYDSSQPYLSALVVVGLFVGFLGLGAALVVRFALLAVLVILSPLAALLYVLPETQHYTRIWSTLFATALLLQPLELLVLGVGFGLDASFASPIGHLYALASLWIAMKIPGALRSGVRRTSGAS